VAKEGYVIFVFTMRPARQADAEPRPLDDVDGTGKDVLQLASAKLTPLVARTEPITIERYETAHDFTGQTPYTDMLMVEGEAGPYGTAGKLKDVDNGNDRAFTSREAAMRPMRTMIVRWPGCRHGLLFAERRGASNMRREVEDQVLRPVARELGMKLDLWAHVDVEAWEAFLERSEVSEVRAVYRSTRDEDYLPDERKQPNLTIAAEGPLAKRLGKDVLQTAVGRAKGAVQRMFALDPEERDRGAQVESDTGAPAAKPSTYLVGDLRPSAKEYEDEQVTIRAADATDERLVEITGGRLPQWVYRTDGRLTPAQARETWTVDARRILRTYTRDVPAGWQTQ
jgi:hypothetical protein